jgi:HK97 family phage portal protein
MPLKLYERVGNSKKELLGHPISDLLTFAPSVESTPKRLWHEFYTAVLLHGTGYLEITKNPATGLVSGLWFHDSRSVRAYRNPQGDLLFDITVGAVKRTLPDSSIVRVAAFASGNGVTGRSAVEYARGVLGEAIAQDRFGQRIFGNFATPSGVITVQGNVKPEIKQMMRNDWMALQGSGNQTKIAVLDAGMDYKPISFSPEDASWIKSRQLSREFVCGLFHVSTQLVASEARVSGETYAAQMLSFYQLALKPLMIDTQQQLLQKLFPTLVEQRNALMTKISELAKKDSLDSLEKVSFDKMSADIESLTLDVNRAQRAADIDAEIRGSQRPPRAAINDPSVSKDPAEVHAQEVRAFEAWMKGTLQPDDRKYLRYEERAITGGPATGTTGGGVLVPVGIDSLHVATKNIGELLGAIRVVNSDSTELLRIPFLNDVAQVGSIQGENVASAESDMALNSTNSYVDQWNSGLITVGNPTINSSAFNVQEFISEAISTRFQRYATNSITNGNSSNVS